MATIKHISSKNADYGAAERYLTFQFDESSRPILDKNGRLVPREDYRIETLNCDDEDFALSCIRANMKYKKNNQKGDIKTHHYIISFDPRDAKENGLTLDRAQELGIEWCRKHLPGHQALVCTHPDGHNHSGNIHVHIVINSLRTADVERKDYMDRPCDSRAGSKHRCTAAAFRSFRSGVMEMCQREGLHQIDLLSGSREKITDREYYAKIRGQERLDKQDAQDKNQKLEVQENPSKSDKHDTLRKQENSTTMDKQQVSNPTEKPQIQDKSEKETENGIPKKTAFQTEMDRMREQIRAALKDSASFDAFSAKLFESSGITVKESRGRYSYLPQGRVKPITARRLGTDFDRNAVLSTLEANAKYLTEEETARENAVLREINEALQEERIRSDRIKELDSQIDENRELYSQTENYIHYKPVYDKLDEMKNGRRRTRYEEENRLEISRFNVARRYFKERGITKLPSLKELKEKIKKLVSERDTIYAEYLKHRAENWEKRGVKVDIENRQRKRMRGKSHIADRDLTV